MDQVHGSDVAVVDGSRRRPPAVDALVTAAPGPRARRARRRLRAGAAGRRRRRRGRRRPRRPAGLRRRRRRRARSRRWPSSAPSRADRRRARAVGLRARATRCPRRCATTSPRGARRARTVPWTGTAGRSTCAPAWWPSCATAGVARAPGCRAAREERDGPLLLPPRRRSPDASPASWLGELGAVSRGVTRRAAAAAWPTSSRAGLAAGPRRIARAGAAGRDATSRDPGRRHQDLPGLRRRPAGRARRRATSARTATRRPRPRSPACVRPRRLRWHFIGQLQTQQGAARSPATPTSCSRSTGPSSSRRWTGRGRRAGRRLDVPVQVSLDGEPGRGGVAPGGGPRPSPTWSRRAAAADPARRHGRRPARGRRRGPPSPACRELARGGPGRPPRGRVDLRRA